MSAGDLITGPGQIQFRDLLLGLGTDYDVTKLAGWEDMPPVDVGSRARPRQHGADPGRMLAQPQAVTATFDINPQAAGGTGPARQFLRSRTGLPEDARQEPIAVCLDAGTTMIRYGQLTARNVPLVINYENVIKDAVLQWQCADPRLYSSVTQSLLARLAVAAPASQAVRTNYQKNPLAAGTGVGFAGYTLGTGEAVTTTWITGAGDGPIPEITTYGRATITTPKTAGTSGWSALSSSMRGPAAGGAGDLTTESVYVRSSVTTTIVMRAAFYTSGGSTVNYADSGSIALPAGQWVRISSTATASNTYASVAWWARIDTATILAAGTTVDATGALDEMSGTLGTFFSGATPNAGSVSHAWTGTANASTSTETLNSPGVYPNTYPSAYATIVAGGGPQSATNNGNAPTPPVYTISGPATSPSLTISDSSGTRQTTFGLSLAATDSLVIDVLNRTVTLGGADRYGFSSGTPIEALQLNPGTSTISLGGTGDATTQLTVTFSDAYI
jgi:hypothetical protein